jgi:UDP-N-acetylmuramoylalanine--D-glutamate ligase
MDYKDKRVLIFGLGLNEGGLGAAKFFASQGAIVRVTDLKDEIVLEPSIKQLKEFKNIEYILGQHRMEDIEWADLIIKNAGIKPGNSYLEHAKKLGKAVEMDMGIFLELVNPKNIIGITGTKGKSTTSTLIYEVLKLSGKKVVFAGNIGKSVLDTIPYLSENALVVLEISSFQLEAFNQHKVSPHIAVITNIYPDHLNYYSSMDEYIAAKKLITKYQTKEDLLFLRKSDPITTQAVFLNGVKSQIKYFSREDLPKNLKAELKGSHNWENIAAAFNVIKTLGVDEIKFKNALSNFTGIPFRMQVIKEWNGIKIYNDTTATGPDASIAAIKALSVGTKTTPGHLIVIAGGMNKNMPYENYVQELEKSAKEVFFLAGDATDLIISLLREARSTLLIHGPYDNLEDLLEDVKKVSKDEDIILFSPAATSFNMFQNEFDRGRKFNEAVEKIFV